MVGAVFATDEELLNETKKLLNRLGKKVVNIEALGEQYPQWATSQYRETIEKYGVDLEKLDRKELWNMYRDLKYINNLKTATVEGAKSAHAKFQKVRNKLNSLSPDLQKKFWEMYSKAVSNESLREKFRYDIMSTAIDNLEISTDEFALNIEKYYKEKPVEIGTQNPELTEEEINVLFSKDFRQYLKSFNR